MSRRLPRAAPTGHRVLLSEGASGQSHSQLGAVRALSLAGHEVHVTVSAPHSTAGWSRHCDRQIPAPTVDDPSYPDEIARIVAAGGYTAVLPASDAAVAVLDLPGACLIDKEEVGRRARAAGFPPAEELAFSDGDALVAAASDLDYPVAVKSSEKRGTDALIVWRADGPADLAVAAGYPHPMIAQRWLLGQPHAVSGVMFEGRLRASLHQKYDRTWPRRAGVTTESVTTEPDLELEERATEIVRDHEGVWQVQLIGDTVIDVNPRVYGSVVLSAFAGVNLPDVLVRLCAGEDVAGGRVLRAHGGHTYRWIEGDLRSLLDAYRASDLSTRGLLAALAPVRHTVHADVWLSDPGPTLARAVHVLTSRRGPR